MDIDSINLETDTILNISGDAVFCPAYETATLTVEPGWDSYEWYTIEGGMENLFMVTETPSLSNITTSGVFLVKGFWDNERCPAISFAWTLDTITCENPNLNNIGGLTWVDLNEDGIQDGTEPNLSNVKVKLHDGLTNNVVDSLFTDVNGNCLLYTSPSPRDLSTSRMPSSA